MTDETFACHSNERKSDFSNWVADAVKDQLVAILVHCRIYDVLGDKQHYRLDDNGAGMKKS